MTAACVAGFAALLVPSLSASLALADASAAEESRRFELSATADFLFRVDSATGEVWAVPASGDGGWQAMGGAPDAAGAPAVAGRYRLAVLGGRTRGAQPGASRPNLLRTDRATGRAWLAVALPDGKWELIPEPAAGAPR